MGKKQYQSQGRYARQGSQAKRRKLSRPRGQSPAPAAPQESEAKEVSRATTPATPVRPRTAGVESTYAYIVPDLIQTAILATIAFIILIILAVVL